MKQHTNIRLEEELKIELLDEAKRDNRSFTNYVELLLKTHPSRQVKSVLMGTSTYKKK